MEGHRPHRPLCQQGNQSFASGLRLSAETRQVCEKGRNGCHAIRSVRPDDASWPTFDPAGDIDWKAVQQRHCYASVLVGNGAELLIKWNPVQWKSAVTDTADH